MDENRRFKAPKEGGLKPEMKLLTQNIASYAAEVYVFQLAGIAGYRLLSAGYRLLIGCLSAGYRWLSAGYRLASGVYRLVISDYRLVTGGAPPKEA